MSKLVDVVEKCKSLIDDETEDLSDEDYVEVMEEIESYVCSCADTKREEMDSAHDDEEDEE